MAKMREGWLLWGLGAALSGAFLTGCETSQQAIAKRIRQDHAFFASLPEDAQERLQGGQLQVGDSTHAAWIVYGEPTRTYERITVAATNLVWSYRSTDMIPMSQFHTVHYPVRGRYGGTYWASDLVLQNTYLYSSSEYLRIEFNDNKVIAIDRFRTNE